MASCWSSSFQNGKVVGWYEQPRRIELGHLANDKGYSRSEAVFNVDRSSGRVELKSPTAATAPATKAAGQHNTALDRPGGTVLVFRKMEVSGSSSGTFPEFPETFREFPETSRELAETWASTSSAEQHRL
jgi:hypothetical protein